MNWGGKSELVYSVLHIMCTVYSRCQQCISLKDAMSTMSCSAVLLKLLPSCGIPLHQCCPFDYCKLENVQLLVKYPNEECTCRHFRTRSVDMDIACHGVLYIGSSCYLQGSNSINDVCFTKVCFQSV